MKNIEIINKEESKSIVGGEAISLTLVLTCLAISILTVIVWKFYTSTKGKVVFPGGFHFEWSGSSAYVNRLLKYFIK